MKNSYKTKVLIILLKNNHNLKILIPKNKVKINQLMKVINNKYK